MVTEDEKEVLQDYWNSENHIASEMPDYCEHATRALFDHLLPDVQGKKVLDIGCGHGQTLEYFQKRGAQPYGVDMSPESVYVARQRGFEVEEGDCCALPYPNESFDVVFSIGVIEHFAATKKAIAEHIRVLRPSGKAVIIVPHLKSPSYFGAIAWHFLRGNFLKYSIKTTTGKGYTKMYFKRILDDGKAKNLHITGYYGSAFLKPLTSTRWEKIAQWIDSSVYSRMFGHLIAGIYEK